MLEFKVNSATLLKKVVAPIAVMAATATINYSSYGISLQAKDPGLRVLAVLRLNPLHFDFFRCNVIGQAGINPKTLHQTLDIHVGEEWSVTVEGDDEDIMGFLFQNAAQGIVEYHDMNLLDEVPDERVDLNFVNYGFRADVGISSDRFMRILLVLSSYGGFVTVSLTHNQVKLSTLNREIVLKTENDQCVITGVAENESIRFSFGLEQMAAYLNASLLTSMAYFLIPVNNNLPYRLHFLLGVVGNLMFYFL